MRQVQILGRLLHGRKEFQEGDVVSVDDDTAFYFVGHGWAQYHDNQDENDAVFNTLDDGPVDIDVDNIEQVLE